MDRNSMDVATGFVRRGWSVVPVPFKAKRPSLLGWEQLRCTEVDLPLYFGAGRWNIGVLLGAPSNGLVDADLDHELAVAIAPMHLPPTGAIFGRRGKPRSHWLFRASEPVATQHWRLPDRRMVVELRSTGAQTVFPGSLHPSGEPIEWDTDGEPAIVEPEVLKARLARIYDEVCWRLGIEQPVHSPARRRGVSAPSSVVQRARRYLAKLPPAVSGQGGHAATFRAACVLTIGFGLDRDQALCLLEEWNRRCEPPWSDKELEHKVDDALRQPGWRGHLLNGPRGLMRSLPGAIERANRHAIAHRRRLRRRARV